MDKKNYTGIVPAQHSGQKIDTSSSVDCSSEQEAKTLYEQAKQRLLDVNHWQQLAGELLANFQLTDAQGREVNRMVQEDDYFKIDIPGPGSKSGEGYDWVQVESINEVQQSGVQSIGIRVRPAPDPQNESTEPSHFYSDKATSNFTITREGNTVTAAIYDRNVKPNEQPEAVTDKLRNSVVGAGAIAVFSRIQWKRLAEGLVKS